MHIKRKTIPQFWPIAKTGTKYIAVASHDKTSSIPLVIAMRDILKLVKNSKEMKKLLHEKKILINNKIVNEMKYPLVLFDVLSMPSAKKSYRIVLEQKKFSFEESSEKEAGSRAYKVIGKKILPGKKVQLNLSSGKNMISNEKVSCGDFIVLGSGNKIIKKISLEKGVEVVVVSGKHMGKKGKIISLEQVGENKIALLSTKEGELKVNTSTLFAYL